MARLNKTDANELNEQLEFPMGQDPDSISWQNGDQICISNTLFAAIFSIFTFSSACYIVIGLQILNYFEKEKRAQMELGDYKHKTQKTPTSSSSSKSKMASSQYSTVS